MTSSKQEALFKQAKSINYLVDRLAAFVQNDIERLYQDGYVTLKDIYNNRLELDNLRSIFDEKFTNTANDIDAYILNIIEDIKNKKIKPRTPEP